MILDLDCGNTLIKWQLQTNGRVFARGRALSDQELVRQVGCQLDTTPLDLCRLASVRSPAETQELLAVLQMHYPHARLLQAAVVESCAGVHNGYLEPGRLGLDRWLAMLGAYHAARQACLVLDLGTAVTADLVDAAGRHLGGYICPGLPLMRTQLQTHTRRIRYDEQEAALAPQELAPGCSTAEAVERGCILMLRGFVLTQLELARSYWQESFEVFLTGGDASLVADHIPGVRHVPDLVFSGLALACPLGGEV